MQDLDGYLGEIVAGDADAFGRWVACAEPEVRASLRPLAAMVDAEAVLQEALLRVWQTAPRFRPDGEPNGLLRLAVRIARNLALGEVRRTRPELTDSAELEGALLERSGADPRGAPDPLLRRLIEECRKMLPGKPAQALEQRLLSWGAEPDEVLAQRVGMKLNTFLQNFTRARRFLAECLKGRGVDLEAELP